MEPVLGSATASHRRRSPEPRWGIFTNHFLVVAAIAVDPRLLIREIAELVGITERATQAIIRDLIDGGYLQRTRIGRRNHYRIHRSVDLRHPLAGGHTLGELLDLLARERSSPSLP